MSLLNQLFNRGVFGSKCKTCLNLAISRIKLLQNKRDLQLKHMRKEIAQFLQAGQEAIARIRVEHVIREQNIRAAYEILELFCEFVLVRVPILESQKKPIFGILNARPSAQPLYSPSSCLKNCEPNHMVRGKVLLNKSQYMDQTLAQQISPSHPIWECPAELREAIASIIFAAPRCSEVPDLLQIKNLFAAKYGKEFNMAATELRPDSGVNRAIIERLSVRAPPAEARLKVLKEIAQEFSLEWDSSNTEAELGKKHEDLLGGSKQIMADAILPQAPTKQSSPLSPPSNGAHSTLNTDNKQGSHRLQAPALVSNMPQVNANEIEPSIRNYMAHVQRETTSQSSDVLERAQAAIASAERATIAARAAAELVNVQFG
ncbi:hypothetical protein POTOM_029922 [Populus tomentosa]|uniref:Regulator of Vps4 activity in the MVB pathway protein n=1 Tax=Populus tomentosa TaxID=118781 RepID=A0A8X8CTC4_POPTO|nr:hypothetical protein POTOM_029922 [Populus tomentosa]